MECGRSLDVSVWEGVWKCEGEGWVDCMPASPNHSLMPPAAAVPQPYRLTLVAIFSLIPLLHPFRIVHDEETTRQHLSARGTVPGIPCKGPCATGNVL